MTSNHLFHDHDEDVHVDDDGSVKDIENHNQDGAHDIADADNNNIEAVADPHLTVEVIMLMTRSWLLRLEFPYQPGNFRSHQTSF